MRGNVGFYRQTRDTALPGDFQVDQLPVLREHRLDQLHNRRNAGVGTRQTHVLRADPEQDGLARLQIGPDGFDVERLPVPGTPVGPPGEQVHGGAAEKLGDEGVDRSVVERLVSASLDDFARAHDGDAIGQGDGFGLVVSHVDAGDAVVAQQALELHARLNSQLGVEIGERLIE